MKILREVLKENGIDPADLCIDGIEDRMDEDITGTALEAIVNLVIYKKGQIEYKSRFYGWKTITKDQALSIAKHWYKSITTMENDTLIDYINSKLRGIQVTVKDLI